MLRDQPSPTQPDGTLRDMVDSDSQIDQGGNPLGEGTIMGRDGEQPPEKRDNFMHGHILAALVDDSESYDPYEGMSPRDRAFHEKAEYEEKMARNPAFRKTEEETWRMDENDHDPPAYVCPECGVSAEPHLGDPTHLKCPGCKLTFDPRDWAGVERGFENNQVLEHPDPWMDNEPGSLTIPKGHPSLWSRTAGPWDDPMDNLSCPNCSNPVMPDRETSDIFCTNCNHTWPIHRDEPYGQQHFLPAEMAEYTHQMVGPPRPNEQATLHPSTDHPGLILPERGTGFGPKHVGTHQADDNPPLNQVSMSRTNDMEPYLSLWEEEPIEKTGAALAELGPELLGGGEAGGAGAAGGGASGFMGKALPSMAGTLMGKALGGEGGNQAGGGGQAEAPYESPLSPLAALLHHADHSHDHDTPTSNPDVGVKNDDPEDVDTHEFNDRDHSPNPINPNLEDNGASGEDEVRDQAGFGENSPAIERMGLLMPLIMHFYNSEESGANDPMLKELHQMLLTENPNYLKDAPEMDEHQMQELLKTMAKPEHGHAHAKTALVPPMQQGFGMGLDPQGMGGGGLTDYLQQLQQAGQQVGLGGGQAAPGGVPMQGHCPSCGGVLTADGSCPQCGAKRNGMGGTTPAGQDPYAGAGGVSPLPPNAASYSILAALVDAANHQGPVTPEQTAVVQEWLIENGRAQEAPNVPLDPGNPEYVKILAEIQGNQNIPPSVTPEEQTQPPAPQMQAPGGMPVPGMGAGEAGGQPMSPLSAILAADNIAARCPKCGSATTGMLMDEGGHQNCHSCGHVWKADSVVTDKSVNKESSTRTALVDGPDAAQAQASPNPMGVPAAEQDQALNQGGDEDSSLTWKDTTGQPIQAGQEYEMINPSYSLPDVVRVIRVKPDGLEVQILGTWGGGDQHAPATHISKEAMELQKLTFEPVGQNADQRGNEAPQGSAPGYQSMPPSGQTTDEHDNSFPATSSVVEAVVENDDTCPRCGHLASYSSMSSPSSVMHDCDRCGSSWETKEDFTGVESNAHQRDWLNEESDEEFFGGMSRMQMGSTSRDLSSIARKDTRLQQIGEYLEGERQARTAGRKFSPREQRELVDEDGVARNSDLLQLEGTHYRTRENYDSRVNPDNVPDSHFMLGL